MESSEQPMRRALQRPEVLIATFYLLTFTLVLMPYYDWFYRLTVDFLHAISFWLSPCIIVLIVVPLYLFERCFMRALLAIAAGSLVVFAGCRVHGWRYQITEGYIRSHYCPINRPAEEDSILGGIKEIRIDGTERTGAFENDSHCLIPVCAEELFYCDDATP